jgi:zinc protease
VRFLRALCPLILRIGTFAAPAAAAASSVLLAQPLVRAGDGPALRGGQAASTAAAETPRIAFEKFTLPNGLQVILHVDRTLPIVHVNQWFHVGSKNEKPGRTGFAHLFEHMMFQGSKHVPGEYFSLVEKLGANLREGGVNGTTDFDRTNYFATVPSGNLETLLWLESDRLATLLDVTTQEKLDNQRDVVKNERRQGLENQPYGRWFDLLGRYLMPAGHPYSWPVIGSMEDLSAATLDDVREFFRTYYTPNNLSLVIAGDFDPAEARRLVEKYYGGIPPGPALDRPARWVPSLEAERVVEVKDRVPQERVYLAWPAPEYFAPGTAELALLSRILTDGLSARLNRALVYDRQLCTTVSSFVLDGEIAGAFIIVATARPGSSLADIERIVGEEIGRIAREGPSAEELARAKTKHEFEFISGLERIGGFGGKADLLNQYNTYLGDPGMFERDLARHREATIDGVRAAAARWLDTPNRLALRFRPETSSRPGTPDIDRSQQPPFGADRPFRAPTVEAAALDNGLQVLVVSRRELPKVAVSLVTRAGSAADPEGRSGTAYLTMRTIDLGTRTRGALDIEDALGNLGTSLAGTTGREVTTLAFEVLSRNLGAALGIVADVVRNAQFPDAEVEREKRRLLDAIAQQERSPEGIAARVRPMLVFGAAHPYGRPVQGFRSTVERLTRADLAAFHAARWKPGGTALVFVGNVTLDEARTLARQHFGDWAGGAPAPVAVPPPAPARAGTLYLVDRPDAAQTFVTQWLPAPPRRAPDYDAFRLVDAVWAGGGFGTRLNLNLREEKGYSYGVFSNVAFFGDAGLWAASGGVQTDKTRESVVEFDRELKALATTRPVTAEEFEAARVRRLRGYPQQFESYGRVAAQIGDLWALGLPMTELQREYDATAALTLEAVLAAARKYVRPEAAGLLLVGDRARIEAGLRDAGLGPVVLLDVEGRPAAGATAAARPR